MKKLAVAMVLVVGSTLILADDKPAMGSTDTTGKAAAKGAGDSYLAKDFWDKYAKGGYLSKEDVSRFKGADGKSVDTQKIDLDGDGRVSEREWTTYQQTAGAAGQSPQGMESRPGNK